MTRYLPIGLLLLAAAGCAAPAPPRVMTRDEFATLYDDHQVFTDVYYMGDDSEYHWFCFEHWTLKPDGSDAKLDLQEFCRVPVDELGVKGPYALSHNENDWRLMRPMPPPTTDRYAKPGGSN